MSKRRERHSPEQIVKKLRDGEAMLNAGKDLATVLQSLEVSEATWNRWRNQYGGKQRSRRAVARMKAEAVVPFDQRSGCRHWKTRTGG